VTIPDKLMSILVSPETPVVVALRGVENWTPFRENLRVEVLVPAPAGGVNLTPSLKVWPGLITVPAAPGALVKENAPLAGSTETAESVSGVGALFFVAGTEKLSSFVEEALAPTDPKSKVAPEVRDFPSGLETVIART